MADSGNPEDLVSQVTVTGTEESLAKLDAYAAGGAASFNKLNNAAKESAAGVAGASATIDAAGKTAQGGSVGFGRLHEVVKALPDTLKSVGSAFKDLGDKIQPLTQAVGRFSQRIALAGTAAVAAGVGIAKSASNVAKAADGQSSAMKDSTDVLMKNNDAILKADERSISHASSVRGLNKQLTDGKLSYSEYGKALTELDAQEREAIQVQNQMEAAQERAKEANDRLQKSLASREAYAKLIDTFGGPLTQSLVSFGHQVNQLHTQFLAAFGPGIAQGIDLISSILSKNAQAISAFFDTAGQKISQLLTQNGPAITKLIENIGSGVSKVFLGILDALPGVIDFLNNVVVPSIQKVSSAFSSVAGVINSVFGTQLTGGSLILIAILAQVTGSIKLLFVLMRSGGAVLSGLIGVVEAVGVGLAEAFGAKKVAQIISMGAAVSKGKGLFATLGAAIRIVIPLITLLATTIAQGLGIALGPVYILLLLVAAGLVYLATKADWKKIGAGLVQFGKDAVEWFGKIITKGTQLVTDIKTAFSNLNAFLKSSSWSDSIIAAWESVKQKAAEAAQWVREKWDAVVQWFSDIGDKISSGIDSAWETVKQLAADTVQWIQDKWQALVALFSGWGEQIRSSISSAWESVKQMGADAAQWIKDKWDALVGFFTGLPGQLQGVWDGIKNAIMSAFQSAIDAVKGYFAGLLASAKQFLQPIIDLLNSIASLSASAGGAEAAAGHASGGYISGPGGPTDDKIPAWLSNGEFVVKAHSVAKYGMDFLHRINSGSFSMPRFAMGGLVGIPRIAYAEGGEANKAAMRPINLSLFGEQFNGLMAPEDVGQRLGKFAISRQNQSAGRKPAWVGSGRN